MNRRDTVLALLALGPLAVPLRALAQQSKRVFRVGFMYGRGRPTPSGPEVYLDAFTQKMRELGYVDGVNLIVEWRYANGEYQRHPGHASELARLNVDVIVTSNLPSTLAAKHATSTIPIVFAAMVDPVGSGIVKSLARPEGNVTGFSLLSIDVVPKQVELLASVIPKLSRIACLLNPLVPVHKTFLTATQAAAQQIGATVLPVEAKNTEEIERGFAAMAGWTAQAVTVPPDSFFTGQRSQIVQLALKNRIATMLPYGADAESGALLSYGPDLVDYYRNAAGYVGKILKGAKISDLPVEQAIIFQFMVNMKTAKALGLKIPAVTLLRADKVIE